MLKEFTRICPALLAPALLVFAAAAACAQGPNDVRQTPDAADSSRAEAAAPAGGQKQRAADTGRAAKATAPLSADEKIGRSLRSAFLRPTPYVMSAFSAGITQWREDRLPNKTNADELADWGSRAARNFATAGTQTLFASGIYPALLRQDPRYDPSTSKSFGRRTLHAASRVFVARHDDGRLEPNYSRFAGVMTASALANLWEHSTPRHDRIGADATLNRFATLLTGDLLTNIVFKEFGPDIVRIFRH